MTETEVVGALLLPQDTAHKQKIVNTITLIEGKKSDTIKMLDRLDTRINLNIRKNY